MLRYLQKSKFYQNASDVGREAMVRSVKKQLGIRVKSAPVSAKDSSTDLSIRTGSLKMRRRR